MDYRLKEFYKHYPDRFIEDFSDIKLSCYQRVFLRMISLADRK